MSDHDGSRNGFVYNAQEEDQRLDERLDEMESHIPRIGAVEHDVILLRADKAELARQFGAVHTNLNNLRLQTQEQFSRLEQLLLSMGRKEAL